MTETQLGSVACFNVGQRTKECLNKHTQRDDETTHELAHPVWLNSLDSQIVIPDKPRELKISKDYVT